MRIVFSLLYFLIRTMGFCLASSYTLNSVISECDQLNDVNTKKQCYENVVAVDRIARKLADRLRVNLTDLPRPPFEDRQFLLEEFCARNTGNSVCAHERSKRASIYKSRVQSSRGSNIGRYVRDSCGAHFATDPLLLSSCAAGRVYFDVSQFHHEKYDKAKLTFGVRRPPNSDVNKPLTVQVTVSNYISEHERKIVQGPILMEILPNQRWVILDSFQTVVENWVSNGNDNHGLFIAVFSTDDIDDYDLDDAPNLLLREPDSHGYDQSVILHVTPLWTTMAAMECNKKGAGSCCRQPVDIDFERIGFQFVLAPRRMRLHFCAGNCSLQFTEEQHALHSFLRHKLLNIGKVGHGEISASCCAPTEYTSMKIVVIDKKGSVSQMPLDNVSAATCTCL